jgi:hypothetical protein
MAHAMGEASTVLTSVKEGDLWRVQIAWPNGAINFFGKFGSELEAGKWISTHRRLTEQVIDDTEIRRRRGSSRPRGVSSATLLPNESRQSDIAHDENYPKG